MMPCIYEDDEGQPVRVHGDEPMDDDDQAAMRTLVAAVKRRFREEKAREEAGFRSDERARWADRARAVAEQWLRDSTGRPLDGTTLRWFADLIERNPDVPDPTDPNGDLGEQARRQLSIDGTAGDAQDIDHPYIAGERGSSCVVCGCAPGYRRHTGGPVACPE